MDREQRVSSKVIGDLDRTVSQLLLFAMVPRLELLSDPLRILYMLDMRRKSAGREHKRPSDRRLC